MSNIANQPGIWYEGSFHPISYGLGPLDNLVDIFVGDSSLIMAGFVIGMGSFLISLGNLFPKTYQKMIIVIPSTVLTIVGIRAFYEIWRYGKGWWPFAHGEWNPVGPLTS